MFHIIRMDHQLVSLIKRPQSMTQYVKASSESYDKTWSISYFPYPHRKITGHIREHCLKLIIIQSFGRRIYFSIFSSVTIFFLIYQGGGGLKYIKTCGVYVFIEKHLNLHNQIQILARI